MLINIFAAFHLGVFYGIKLILIGLFFLAPFVFGTSKKTVDSLRMVLCYGLGQIIFLNVLGFFLLIRGNPLWQVFDQSQLVIERIAFLLIGIFCFLVGLEFVGAIPSTERFFRKSDLPFKAGIVGVFSGLFPYPPVMNILDYGISTGKLKIEFLCLNAFGIGLLLAIIPIYYFIGIASHLLENKLKQPESSDWMKRSAGIILFISGGYYLVAAYLCPSCLFLGLRP